MINKIVLADDEPDILEIANKRLKRNGFDVYPAKDGKEAYALITKYSPDIIVTDVIMPVMNGFELCKAVKHNDLTKDIPIIVLSAKTNMEDSFLYLGVNNFLSKPLSLEHLENAIKERITISQILHTQKTSVLFYSSNEMVLKNAQLLIEQTPEWRGQFTNNSMNLIEQAYSLIPDIIILDLLMKDAHIDDIIEKIKANPDLKNTDILIYYSPASTAQDEISIQAKMIEVQYLKRLSLEAGAKEYLGPFKTDTFLDLINVHRKDFV